MPRTFAARFKASAIKLESVRHYKIILTCDLSGLSRPKACAVLSALYKGPDHLSRLVVSSKLIELSQPEVIAAKVRIRRGIGIAAEVSEIFD